MLLLGWKRNWKKHHAVGNDRWSALAVTPGSHQPVSLLFSYFINVPLRNPNAIPPDLLDAGRSSHLSLGLIPPLQSGVLCYHSRLWVEKYIFLLRLWITLPEPAQPVLPCCKLTPGQQQGRGTVLGPGSCRTWSWSMHLWWLWEWREVCRDDISSCKKLILH